MQGRAQCCNGSCCVAAAGPHYCSGCGGPLPRASLADRGSQGHGARTQRTSHSRGDPSPRFPFFFCNEKRVKPTPRINWVEILGGRIFPWIKLFKKNITHFFYQIPNQSLKHKCHLRIGRFFLQGNIWVSGWIGWKKVMPKLWKFRHLYLISRKILFKRIWNTN